MNPFLSKKVMMDVPDNVKEETVLDEGSGPKGKQRRPYTGGINSPAARAAAEAQHEKMAAADKAKKGEELLDKIKQKNEEVEQLDELGNTPGGREALLAVRARAIANRNKDFPDHYTPRAMKAQDTVNKVNDRLSGNRTKRLAGPGNPDDTPYTLGGRDRRSGRSWSEEVEQIDEVGDTPAGRAALRAVRDRADATKAGYEKRGGITGRTPEERASQRRELSKAARASVTAGNRLHGFGPVRRMKSEEVEQVDENDLGSEFDKFVADRNANRKPGQPKMTPRTAQSVRKPGGPKTPDDALAHMVANIPSGIRQRGLKNEMNERELSGPETAEKERIVKGMKKGLAGFKARYGERAKNVMYATATKKAKENK
jgi:hypothetical protein